jgi:septum site-determining protein MinC
MSVTPLEQTLTAIHNERGVISSSDIGSDPSIATEITSEQTQVHTYLLDPRDSDDTLFLRRTVRSGQAIHHASNIVVLGDVNPGAEIVASGDIIVWGVLRGMVHAGYPNNENAIVCSLLLAPVQLRIADLLSRPPDGFQVQARPEFATIKNGQIVVEAWVNGHGRTARK